MWSKLSQREFLVLASSRSPSYLDSRLGLNVARYVQSQVPFIGLVSHFIVFLLNYSRTRLPLHNLSNDASRSLENPVQYRDSQKIAVGLLN